MFLLENGSMTSLTRRTAVVAVAEEELVAVVGTSVADVVVEAVEFFS